MKTLVYRIIGAVLIVFSIWFAINQQFSEPSIYVLVIGAIFGYVLIALTSSKMYNHMVGSVNRASNKKNLTTDELFAVLQNVDTGMGKPWMGKIFSIKDEVIIYGPTEFGEYLYIYPSMDAFFVTQSSILSHIQGPETELWRVDAVEKRSDTYSDEYATCFFFIHNTVMIDIANAINEYMETDRITPLPKEANPGKIYRFDEDFRFFGQNFSISDFDGNELYKVIGHMPLKNFRIVKADTEEEIFRMKKRLFHIFDTYDFYKYGKKYGRLKQRFHTFKDVFKMKTEDGIIEIKEVSDFLIANYIVKLDGKTIGTIAERLNLSFHNIVFDNFVLHVRDEKHIPIMTACGVMVIREVRRDRKQMRRNLT